MLIDSHNVFSNQATPRAVETTYSDVLDLSEALGDGEPVQMKVFVDGEAFDSAEGDATLQVALETDDNETFASPATLATTSAIAEDTLVDGYVVPLSGFLGQGVERYLRLSYTVGTHAFIAGKISGFLALTLDKHNVTNVDAGAGG